MLKTFAVFTTLALCLTPPALAQLLSYDEILGNLSGDWAVPFEEEGSDDLVTDCARWRIAISIESREDSLWYVAEHRGAVVKNPEPHEQPVEQGTHAGGIPLPALFIEYENETRLDPEGNPVSWLLLMYDKDSFVWSATHWNLKGTTPVRTRCETVAGF